MTAPVPPALRVVILGFGMAGGRLVDDLLVRAAATGRPLQVTVLGAEPYGAYNRVLLSEVVAGRADVATLALTDEESLRRRGVQVRTGVGAARIDRARRVVHADDGTVLPYDRLVLATGARPVIPPVDGLLPDGPLPRGVHVLRTVDDARAIVAASANARNAVVLGGGLLGLEAARGLARRGVPVTVLHHGGHVLERQLDQAGGLVLGRALRALGVPIRTAVRAVAVDLVAGGPAGPRLGAVRVVATGPSGTGAGQDPAEEAEEQVRADLLVLSCGVRPDLALAASAGLDCGRGVRIDDRCTTNDPDIFAIGDCAEHEGRTAGLVAPAWAQARVVADLITGADAGSRYRPEAPVVRLKAADLEVASCGETAPGPWDDDAGLEVVQLLDVAGGRYVKAVVREGRVRGAVVVGDAAAAAELTLLVDRGAQAPTDRSALLTPGRRQSGTTADGDPTLIPDRATVCRCNGVTKRSLVEAWTAGAATVEALGRRTRAGTGCGTCKPALTGLLDWLARSDPAAVPATPPPEQPPGAAPPDQMPPDPISAQPTAAGGPR